MTSGQCVERMVTNLPDNNKSEAIQFKYEAKKLQTELFSDKLRNRLLSKYQNSA